MDRVLCVDSHSSRSVVAVACAFYTMIPTASVSSLATTTEAVGGIHVPVLLRYHCSIADRRHGSENGQDHQQQTQLANGHFRRSDSANNIVIVVVIILFIISTTTIIIIIIYFTHNSNNKRK